MQEVALADWNYDELYQPGTWTAERMFDAEVIGLNGDEIGSVENIVIGTGGKAEAIIAEVGGFWDIGDTHSPRWPSSTNDPPARSVARGRSRAPDGSLRSRRAAGR